MEEKLKVCMFFDNDDSFSMNALEDVSSEKIFGEGENSPFEQEEENKETADEEINPDEIFKEESSQEVVGEGVDKEKEESKSSKVTDEGSSPKKTFYSSALKALKDDGILPDLDDEFISDATSPEKFAEAIELQVNARLEEANKRVKEALDNNVQVDDVRKFENAINYLNNIDDEKLSEESDEAEVLRKQIIYQDYINKGFKPDRAEKEVQKSFNAGTDIEDAIDALESKTCVRWQ